MANVELGRKCRKALTAGADKQASVKTTGAAMHRNPPLRCNGGQSGIGAAFGSFDDMFLINGNVSLIATDSLITDNKIFFSYFTAFFALKWP